MSLLDVSWKVVTMRGERGWGRSSHPPESGNNLQAPACRSSQYLSSLHLTGQARIPHTYRACENQSKQDIKETFTQILGCATGDDVEAEEVRKVCGVCVRVCEWESERGLGKKGFYLAWSIVVGLDQGRIHIIYQNNSTKELLTLIFENCGDSAFLHTLTEVFHKDTRAGRFLSLSPPYRKQPPLSCPPPLWGAADFELDLFLWRD